MWIVRKTWTPFFSKSTTNDIPLPFLGGLCEYKVAPVVLDDRPLGAKDVLLLNEQGLHGAAPDNANQNSFPSKSLQIRPLNEVLHTKRVLRWSSDLRAMTELYNLFPKFCKSLLVG